MVKIKHERLCDLKEAIVETELRLSSFTVCRMGCKKPDCNSVQYDRSAKNIDSWQLKSQHRVPQSKHLCELLRNVSHQPLDLEKTSTNDKSHELLFSFRDYDKKIALRKWCLKSWKVMVHPTTFKNARKTGQQLDNFLEYALKKLTYYYKSYFSSHLQYLPRIRRKKAKRCCIETKINLQDNVWAQEQICGEIGWKTKSKSKWDFRHCE